MYVSYGDPKTHYKSGGIKLNLNLNLNLNFRLLAYLEILEELPRREHEEAFWDAEDILFPELDAGCTVFSL